MELSDYCKTLDEIHRLRYISKISVLGIDLYLIKLDQCSADLTDFPKIMYPDIVMYFVHTKSSFTMGEMKAYKSLEAYNQAVCGWVKQIRVKSYGPNILLLGKVMHSQRLNEKLLSPWIISEKAGIIISAHCDCVAGLGEVCTHVAAVLFSVDESIRRFEQQTCTGIKAYWMPPSNKPVEPRSLHEMDLSNPKRKYLEEHPLQFHQKEENEIPALSKTEKHTLLSNLMESKGSVLHTVTKPFSELIKTALDERKMVFIMSYHKEEYTQKSLTELQQIDEF